MTGAALVALPTARDTPSQLIVGATALALAGSLSGTIPLIWPPLLAVPGAALIGFGTGLPGSRWVPWLMFVTCTFSAPLAARFDGRYRETHLAPVVWVLTIGGAFLTLPDTEEVLVLVGTALPLFVGAVFKIPMGLGVYPLVGVFLWVAAWGGRGRESAVVGAVACLGLLLAEPIAAGRRLPAPVLLLMHSILVAVSARLAGVQKSVGIAVVVATLALLTAAVACRQYVTRRMDQA